MQNPDSSWAVTVPWFMSGDYDALRALMQRDALLPASYSEWHRGVDSRITEMSASGLLANIVIVRPEPFLAFCRQARREPDPSAAQAYAFAQRVGDLADDAPIGAPLVPARRANLH